MAEHGAYELEPKLTPEERIALAPLSDADNPAIVDARKAFTIMTWSIVLFVGVVIVFVLF